jgi:hypothetical protein
LPGTSSQLFPKEKLGFSHGQFASLFLTESQSKMRDLIVFMATTPVQAIAKMRKMHCLKK